MQISDGYQKVRVSKAIRRSVWESHKASCRRTADVVDSFRPGQTARLLPTMKLAARATLDTAEDIRTHNPGFAIGQLFTLRLGYKAALHGGWLPSARLPQDSYTSMTLFAVAASSLAIGRGAFDHEVEGGCSRKVGGAQMAVRYGLLGLPEAAFVHAADQLTQNQYHKAASACMAGAILCALPLEFARVIRWGVLMLCKAPTVLASVLINVTYSAGRCLWNPTQNPAEYVLFLDAPVRQAKSQALAQQVHQSAQALSGLWQTTSAAQVRQVLRDLCEGTQAPPAGGEPARSFVKNLEQLCSTLSGVRGRQISGRQTLEDLCLLDHLFASPGSEDLAPAPWEGSLFRQASLRLHPDKLMAANPPLPPDSYHLADVSYGIVRFMRELQHDLPPLVARGFMAA